MSPTIIIIGATGNTGKNAVRTLSGLVSGQGFRIIGLTRSAEGAAARELSKIPGVEMQEKDWTEIDVAWLQERNVQKAYIAPHNGPSQFADESGLHLALLGAGVKYVVRVSTNNHYISPTNEVYYGRAHWAVENLLSQPEFANLHWTSLQPNFYTTTYLGACAGWIREHKMTGKQTPLKIVPAEDVKVAMIDPEDVGKIGAHLLALEDDTPHNKARYTISGPVDLSGSEIIALVEKVIGEKVETSSFKDTDWVDGMVKSGYFNAKVGRMAYPTSCWMIADSLVFLKYIPGFLTGFDCLWDGRCSISGSPTSEPVMKLAPPQRTPEDALRALIAN